jgi:cell division protein ZapA (FtsZ GTPase activity inhibitor)
MKGEEAHMSAKNTVTVVIGGKIIRLSGYESEEYLQKVSQYLNNKLKALSEMRGYSHMTQEMRQSLLALNIADDYFNHRMQEKFRQFHYLTTSMPLEVHYDTRLLSELDARGGACAMLDHFFTDPSIFEDLQRTEDNP